MLLLYGVLYLLYPITDLFGMPAFPDASLSRPCWCQYIQNSADYSDTQVEDSQ